ncbi:MAG TPA: HD domain-containing phosphohydrolase [Acidimicrobiales bacterium]
MQAAPDTGASDASTATSAASTSQTVSATGGSAATQAVDADARRWKARPGLAVVVRFAAVAAPVVCSTLVVHVVADASRGWHGFGSAMARLALLVGLATATLMLVERGARRLLPLAALCKLALAFPDQAPSRFKLALRTGTANQLARQLADGVRPATDAAGAAEQVLVLASAIGRHDRLTRGHSERVRAYSDLIAQELDLPVGDRERLHWAALVHDIGKTRVRPEVLNKPGRPTDEEWQELRSHPAAAADLVAPLRPWLGEWVDAATQHHERPDGRGYPLGLRGEEITLAGRIVAVADAYDCMTSSRSYKSALPAAQARFELARNAGSQFDADVVRAFLAISIGKLHLVAGPLAWLSQIPVIGTVASAAPGALIGVGASVAAISLGTLALAPPPGGAVAARHFADGAAGQVVGDRGPAGPGSAAEVRTAGDATLDGSGPVGSPSSTSPGSGSSQGGGVVAVVNPDGTVTLVGTPDASIVVPGSPGSTPPANGGPAASPPPSGSGSTPGGSGSGNSGPGSSSSGSGGSGSSGSGGSGSGGSSGPGSGSSTTTTTTVPNSPPHAVADSSTVILSSSTLLAVLANDSDADDGLAPASLSIVTPPAGSLGTASVESGKIRFVAKAILGQAHLTYRICDTRGSCATATATITILL